MFARVSRTRQLSWLAAGSAVAVGLVSFAGPALASPPAVHTPAVDLASSQLEMVPAVLYGLSKATRLADAPTDKVLTLGIAITGQNPDGEKAMSKALEDQTSGSYHKYLTPEEFAAAYGVPAEREQAIVSYLRAGGFTVATPSTSGTYLEATATVAQADALFKVTEGSYKVSDVKDGTIDFVANEQPPQVPSGFDIAAISGLDTLRQFYTADLTNPKLTEAQDTANLLKARAEATGAVKPSANVPVVAGTTLQPRDLWSIYDQPATDLGQGVTSGIFGEGETDSVITQLRLFEAAEHFPKVPVKVIRTEGDTSNDAAYGDVTPAIEWYLDVQALTGMAPDLAQLDLYFAKSLYDADVFQDFSAWANDDNGPTQMNASFGECETNPTNPVTGPLASLPYGTELGDNLEPSGDPILEQASMEGRTLFASAGDTGSGCPALVVPVVGAGNGVAPSQPPLVNYPAASDYAVGVGGTVIKETGGGATSGGADGAVRTEEASWEDTGSGASHFIAEPDAQKNVSAVDIPCVTQPDGTPFGTIGSPLPPTCRGVPDVAALSGNTFGNGYFIYIDGSPSAEGGTSLSSPLTVGMWSRIQAAVAPAQRMRFALPLLYNQYDYQSKGTRGSYGRDFFDVVDNESGATSGAYVDAPGWDYDSGLGVFDVGGLLTDLDGTQNAYTPAAVPAEAPAVAACSTTEYSPAGNATNPLEVSLGNEPDLDLTGTHFSVDPTGTTMTVTVTGPNFTAPMTSGATSDTFKAQWLYNGIVYFIEADGSLGTFSATDGNNNGAATTTDTATATLSSDGKTLTMSAPLAELGSPGAGALLDYPSVDAVLGVGTPAQIGTINALAFTTDQASAGDYLQQTVGQAIQLAPCTAEAAPAASLPEAPTAVFLPLAGLAALLLALVGLPAYRRRRGEIG